MGAESASTTRKSLFPWSQEFLGQSESMAMAAADACSISYTQRISASWLPNRTLRALPSTASTNGFYVLYHRSPIAILLTSTTTSFTLALRSCHSLCVCVCILIAIITDIVYTLFHWKQYFNRIKCASMFPRFYRERERESNFRRRQRQRRGLILVSSSKLMSYFYTLLSVILCESKSIEIKRA